MARTIHAYQYNAARPELAKLISLDEPSAPGVTVRYLDLGSAVLIAAFVLRGKRRYGLRVLSEQERQAYLAERGTADAGGGI